VTTLGAGALTLANQHKPSAVTLDMHLPDMAGWRVLDRIKHDLALRHVPVCVISTDDSKDRAFKSGALAFLEKPIRSKEVLDGCWRSCTAMCRAARRACWSRWTTGGAQRPAGCRSRASRST
jgi:CheY-like chemotaxis protein